MPALTLHDITPEEFLRVLARRIGKPIESFSWWDVWQQMHSHGFTVAKSSGFDILNDISKALEEALKNGETLESFTRRLTPILMDKGWWGRKSLIDPLTGETVNAQLGSARRLGIIYDTNMRMSFSAGNWASIQRNKEGRPYLMYDAVHDSRTRKKHREWGGVDDGKPVVLPCDHSWWATHYPPNGWKCRCGVRSISKDEYQALVAAGACKTEAPAIDWRSVLNLRTGETMEVPAGIDPGFAYNPGEAFLAALRKS
jgi:uncharacterized protein with gpF-like domain